MERPTTNKEWAEESLAAFNEAYKQLQEDKSPVESKYDLFRYAPIIAAKNRNIGDADRGIEMLSVIKGIEHDFDIDDEAKDRYLFNFIYSYIHSHAYADILEEIEADRIMEYINDNYDLFENV